MIGDPTLTGDKHGQSTYPGQAHFADYRVGAMCSACQYHVTPEFLRTRHRYCEKAQQMTGKWLQPVPGTAIACKYFLRRP